MNARLPTPGRRTALAFYAGSLASAIAGGALAWQRYPGAFDWAYTVMSALASQKHNPGGSAWFAGGLGLSMALLWPVVRFLRAHDGDGRLGRVSIAALRVALVCGALLGIERTFVFSLSAVVRKAHEILALLTFLGMYVGVLGLCGQRARRQKSFVWPAVAIVAPLAAIGLTQLLLYFDQRDLGWVDRSWRDMGIPLWLSFAFWQWLAAALLWLALGCLVAIRPTTSGGDRKIENQKSKI